MSFMAFAAHGMKCLYDVRKSLSSEYDYKHMVEKGDARKRGFRQLQSNLPKTRLCGHYGITSRLPVIQELRPADKQAGPRPPDPGGWFRCRPPVHPARTIRIKEELRPLCLVSSRGTHSSRAGHQRREV